MMNKLTQCPECKNTATTLARKCFGFYGNRCATCGIKLRLAIAPMLGALVLSGFFVILFGAVFQVINPTAAFILAYLCILLPLSSIIPFEVRRA
jgi:uncharacterized membrane protein